MDDIRDRLRDIEKTDRHCKAGKAIAYRPHDEDDAELIDALVQCLVECDDPLNVTSATSAQLHVKRMTTHILSNTPCEDSDVSVDGVKIRMTSKEILFSVPDALTEIRCEDLLRDAESRIMLSYEM